MLPYSTRGLRQPVQRLRQRAAKRELRHRRCAREGRRGASAPNPDEIYLHLLRLRSRTTGPSRAPAHELRRQGQDATSITTVFEHHAVLHTCAGAGEARALRSPTCRWTSEGLVDPRSRWQTPSGRTPPSCRSCTPTTRSAPSSPSPRSARICREAGRLVPHRRGAGGRQRADRRARPRTSTCSPSPATSSTAPRAWAPSTSGRASHAAQPHRRRRAGAGPPRRHRKRRRHRRAGPGHASWPAPTSPPKIAKADRRCGTASSTSMLEPSPHPPQRRPGTAAARATSNLSFEGVGGRGAPAGAGHAGDLRLLRLRLHLRLPRPQPRAPLAWGSAHEVAHGSLRLTLTDWTHPGGRRATSSRRCQPVVERAARDVPAVGGYPRSR